MSSKFWAELSNDYEKLFEAEIGHSLSFVLYRITELKYNLKLKQAKLISRRTNQNYNNSGQHKDHMTLNDNFIIYSNIKY